MPKRIVVIEIDVEMRSVFEFLLTKKDWQVLSYGYDDIDLATVQQLQPDLIILDINLIQRGVGWSFLQLLRMEDTTAQIPVFVYTSADRLPFENDDDLAGRRIRILRKPLDIDLFSRQSTEC